MAKGIRRRMRGKQKVEGASQVQGKEEDGGGEERSEEGAGMGDRISGTACIYSSTDSRSTAQAAAIFYECTQY